MRKKLSLTILLALLCALLCGCDMLRPEARTASAPDLSQLVNAPYIEAADAAPSAPTDVKDYYRVDLWLDATQNCGGVNPDVKSMYPHYSRKYREGGFHYRLGAQVGWYESVLRDLLSAAEGRRVRVLRYGNEYLNDDFLARTGLQFTSLASLRRDLMTYALDPDPSLFSTLSAEDMANSFYALGTPQLNQMARFGDASELENPGQTAAMSDALNAQIAGVAAGDTSFLLPQTHDEHECALLYALQSLDFSRLSVLTVDPASLGRLSGAQEDGKPVDYVQALLTERGVFDQGLCAAVYALRLDYVGQLKTIGAADLSEPLLWGKPIYDNESRAVTDVGAMPRILLMLIVGPQAQVEDYTAHLDAQLDADASLLGLRGPQNGELTYAAAGATVTQQPFAFEYHHLLIARPTTGYYTQHTQGASLSGGACTVETRSGLPTALYRPDADGRYANDTLTVRFPLSADDAHTDLSRLQDAQVELVSTLLLAETRPNDGQTGDERNAQTLAYRDTLYTYRADNAPDPEGSPFTLQGIRQEGDALVCQIAVSGGRLTQGYYRLCLRCDLTGEEIVWPQVDWVNELSATLDTDDVYAWERFTAAMTEFDRDTQSIPKLFQHAWGSYTDKAYHGLRVPDCPPVYRAIGLEPLLEQLRQAAAPGSTPYVRYVLDVFADNQ